VRAQALFPKESRVVLVPALFPKEEQQLRQQQ
jgi:hypothetical protein